MVSLLCNSPERNTYFLLSSIYIVDILYLIVYSSSILSYHILNVTSKYIKRDCSLCQISLSLVGLTEYDPLMTVHLYQMRTWANIVTFVHQMGDMCVYHLVNKSDNICLI